MTGKGYKKARDLQGKVTETRGVDTEMSQKGKELTWKCYRMARGSQGKVTERGGVHRKRLNKASKMRNKEDEDN